MENGQEDIRALYHIAFRDYGTVALWNRVPVPNPTREDALAIVRSLRVEGDLAARRLAEQIEEVCRAAPRIQTEILSFLAAHRDPDSYVAGSTPLNIVEPRYSRDIDIFHDREERVARAAENDAAILRANGYSLQWLRREPAIYTVMVSKEYGETKLEWVVDSDFRFFPTIQDDTFGYALHPVDLAINKVMAAAGRREPRDVVDLITVNDRILPIGAVVAAAVEKSPGFTPEGLLNEIRRNANYTKADFISIASEPPVDAAEAMTRLRQVLNDAEEFVTRIPTDKLGLLFLKDGIVVQPDPEHLEKYQTHAGQRLGQWPSSPEIATAMLERYNSL